MPGPGLPVGAEGIRTPDLRNAKPTLTTAPHERSGGLSSPTAPVHREPISLQQNHFDDVERATADRDGGSTGPQFTASKIDLPLTRLVHQSSALRRHIAAPSQDISGLR
jgi:hypothetical protein